MIKKEIAEKLFKAELKQEKVQLGMYQDLENELRAIVPKLNKLEKVSDERLDVGVKYSRLKDEESKLVAEIKEDKRVLEKKLSEAKSKAKELGVDLDVNFIEKNLKQLESAIRANTAF